MTADPRAWLAERQHLADAATEGPWLFRDRGDENFPDFQIIQGDDPDASPYRLIAEVEYGFSDDEYERSVKAAEFIADARSSVPAMVAALTAVLDLHRPMGIYSMEHGDCDHADPESCPPVETDAGAMCGDSPDYYACEECMDVGGELRDDYPEHPCATVRAIQAALGGGSE